MRWVKEPLVQFLAVGVILFAANALFSRGPQPTTEPVAAVLDARETIRVDGVEIAEMRATYEALWSRPPTEAELRDLVDQKVREEVLYRHALELGLDQDDAVIRRRLVQRVRFLTQDAAVIAEPDDAALQRHLEENPRLFALPPKVAFEQLCFSREARGAAAEADALAALKLLKASDNPSIDADEVPNVDRSYPLQKEWNIADVFGGLFAEDVIELEVNGWQGPFESRFGFHLVRVTEREAAELPPLSDVREKVLRDYVATQRAAAIEAYYEDLRKRYEVVIDEPALARSGAATTNQLEVVP
jgi:hypothetical protein